MANTIKTGARVEITSRTKRETRVFTATVTWAEECAGGSLYFGYVPDDTRHGLFGAAHAPSGKPFGVVALRVL